MCNYASCEPTDGNAILIVQRDFTTVSLLAGLTLIELNGKYMLCHIHFVGEMPCFAQNLWTVGEASTVK